MSTFAGWARRARLMPRTHSNEAGATGRKPGRGQLRWASTSAAARSPDAIAPSM
jgi:hypothetical protein